MPERIVVFGQYKTGTTALFYRLQHSLTGQVKTFFESDAYIPKLMDFRYHLLAKIILGQPERVDYASFHSFRKRIVLIRDPRDWLVSGTLFMVQQQAALHRSPEVLAQVLALFRQKEQSPADHSLVSILRVLYRLAQNQSLETTAAWMRQHTQQVMAFEQAERQHLVVRYEDLVDDRLTALERYLGFALSARTEVAAEHAHVPRTKSYGNWKHWFTDEDISFFKPLFQNYLQHYGYDETWELHPHPLILPEHCTGYIERTVQKRLTIPQ